MVNSMQNLEDVMESIELDILTVKVESLLKGRPRHGFMQFSKYASYSGNTHSLLEKVQHREDDDDDDSSPASSSSSETEDVEEEEQFQSWRERW